MELNLDRILSREESSESSDHWEPEKERSTSLVMTEEMKKRLRKTFFVSDETLDDTSVTGM